MIINKSWMTCSRKYCNKQYQCRHHSRQFYATDLILMLHNNHGTSLQRPFKNVLQVSVPLVRTELGKKVFTICCQHHPGMMYKNTFCFVNSEGNQVNRSRAKGSALLVTVTFPDFKMIYFNFIVMTF